MSTNKDVDSLKDVVATTTGPRKYWLSVRLNEIDLRRYSAILDHYKLGPSQYEGSRSDRFRELLEEFSYGLLDEDAHMTMPMHLGTVIRPPLWRRDKKVG